MTFLEAFLLAFTITALPGLVYLLGHLAYWYVEDHWL